MAKTKQVTLRRHAEPGRRFATDIWFLLPSGVHALLASDDDDDTGKLSMRQIVIRSSVLAGMVAVPSLLAFVISWALLDDLLVAAIIGAVVHFIAMGFSLKISKKFLVRKSP